MMFLSLFCVTSALIQTITAGGGCPRCQVVSVSTSGMQIPAKCVQYDNYSVSGNRKLTHPPLLQEVTVILTPQGKGFSITWSTDMEPALQTRIDKSNSRLAAFRLERKFSERNEYLEIVSEFHIRNLTGKLQYNLSCNEDLSDTNYSLGLYSLPDLFRTSTKYSFYGQVLIARKSGWSPSLLIRQLQKNCSNSIDLLINFTLPVTTKYESYDVILCPGDSNCETEAPKDIKMKVVTNSAIFTNVTPGTYGLWLSPPEYLNAATGLTYVMKGNDRQWNPDIKVISTCSTTRSPCNVTIAFDSPEPDFGYSSYSVSLQNRNISYIRYNGVISHQYGEVALLMNFREVLSGSYKLLVLPQGNCPLWNTSIERKFDVLYSSDNSFPETPPVSGYLQVSDAVIILVVSSVLLIAVLAAAKFFSRRSNRTKRKALKRDEFSMGNNSTIDVNCSLKEQTDGVSCGGPLFGCSTPEVLLLYAYDNDVHINAVRALAEVLLTYGGCRVECDQFCRPDVVDRHDWLKEKVEKSKVIVVVDSPGASLIYEAFLGDQMYRKYERAFPTHYHLPATLALAEEQPQVRHRLARVTTGYSYRNSSLRNALVQEFCIPENLQELIFFTHGATPASAEWPCRAICLCSEEYQKMARYLSAMTETLQQNPNHFASTYGPLETRLDSGFNPSSYQQWLGGSIDASTGGTCVFTIPDSTFSNQYDQQNKGSVLQQQQLPGLSTAIPNAEEMWHLFANSNSSINDTMMSYEGFNQMLQGLNSVPDSNVSANAVCLSTDREVVHYINLTGCNAPLDKDGAFTNDLDSISCNTIDDQEM